MCVWEVVDVCSFYVKARGHWVSGSVTVYLSPWK